MARRLEVAQAAKADRADVVELEHRIDEHDTRLDEQGREVDQLRSAFDHARAAQLDRREARRWLIPVLVTAGLVLIAAAGLLLPLLVHR